MQWIDVTMGVQGKLQAVTVSQIVTAEPQPQHSSAANQVGVDKFITWFNPIQEADFQIVTLFWPN